MTTITKDKEYLHEGKEVKWTGRSANRVRRTSGSSPTIDVLYEFEYLSTKETIWLFPQSLYTITSGASQDLLNE